VVPIGLNTPVSGPRIVHTLTGTFILKPIDVKKNDHEDVLFESKAKLYRLDEDKWKERGTGVVKIKQNKENGSKIRILMTRDKIFKICANHYITPNMELKLSPTNDKTWVYTTQNDFSDGEAKIETLAIKFSNKELSNKFFEKVEECKKLISIGETQEDTTN